MVPRAWVQLVCQRKPYSLRLIKAARVCMNQEFEILCVLVPHYSA